MVETETYTIEAPNGDVEEIELPEGLADVFTEQGESPTAVVGDLLIQSFAQQAHGVVHHGQGEISPKMEAAEELTMELFEERFGRTYAEVTGHDH